MIIQIDSLIRSKRKSISLQINPDATLIVRAPLKVSREYIDRLIVEKRDWILKKRAQMEKRKEQIEVRKSKNPDSFLFLGKSYPLRVCYDHKGLSFSGEEFILTANTLSRRKLFLEWYKKSALKIISERVDFYADGLGWKYQKITINSAEKRWGSCSYSGNLNFTWRLVMAPLDVIDYVVVHELVHLKHKDHSRNFWNKVEEIMPDYKQHKNWLKEHGCLLEL